MARVNEEIFEELFEKDGVKIKRITSPKNFKSEVFVQDANEWVMVLQGSAELKMENKEIYLKAGEHVFIPSKTSHQILKTSGDIETVWLAVYLSE